MKINITPELEKDIKLILTNFEEVKEYTILFVMANQLALFLLRKNCSDEEVLDTGITFGYQLKEITILKSSAESIANIVKVMHDANKSNLLGFRMDGVHNQIDPFGVADVLPGAVKDFLYSKADDRLKYQLIPKLIESFRICLRDNQ